MCPNVSVCDRGAAHEVYRLSFAVLRHDLTVDARCRAYVEHWYVDSIGACGDIVVALSITRVEISYDAVFADIDISGFVWVLRHGFQGAVAVVSYHNRYVVHAVAVPEGHVTVNRRVVSCFAGERVLQCFGAVVSCSVDACGVSVYGVGVGGWDAVYVAGVVAP